MVYNEDKAAWDAFVRASRAVLAMATIIAIAIMCAGGLIKLGVLAWRWAFE